MSTYYRIKVYFDRIDRPFIAAEDVYGEDNAAHEARQIASQLLPESRVEIEPIYSSEAFHGTALEQSSGAPKDGG